MSGRQRNQECRLSGCISGENLNSLTELEPIFSEETIAIEISFILTFLARCNAIASNSLATSTFERHTK